jgi:ATP-dependent DNA helicase RecG
MPLNDPKIQELLKPLRLEQKKDFNNRAVSGGLDQYVMRGFAALLNSYDKKSEPAQWLEKTRSAFGQYMALSALERKELVAATLKRLEGWPALSQADSKTSAKPPSAASAGPVLKPAATRPVTALAPDVALASFVPSEKVRAFQRMGLKTVRDLLSYTPKWVLHRSVFTPIAQCVRREEPYFILARINGISQVRRGPREILKVALEDGTGTLIWIWFNRPYLKKDLVNGRWVVLHTIPDVSKWGKQVVGQADTFEFLSDEDKEALEAGKVLPIYSTTPTLIQDFWRGLFNKVLDRALESVGTQVREAEPGRPLGLREAFEKIHRPASLDEFEAARKRLAFEEFLILQTYLILKKNETGRRQKSRRYIFGGEKILKFRKSIPYELTGAQKRVLKEIREDLAKPHPMNRLLQGDVGSGKTVVAAITFLYAADSGIQGALMAPTEILAQQHFETLRKLLEPLGLRTTLLTSGMKAKEKREVLAAMAEGRIDVAVGTHALLEKNVIFKNLGILVIDERHKFGVLQRAALEEKGKWPDALMMTATPFPRALILTDYGDTDLSLLNEFPKGRKPVITQWKPETKKEEVYQFVKARMSKGEQVFWVFPVVEESKTFLKSATQMYQYFAKDIFHGFRVGLLHGRMKKEEKQEVMRAFAERKIQILVSTTVVEVGVDVANATVMVVEHAERFGLAQLHQLRGRVGRGADQAYCFLMTSPLMSSDAIQRVKIMVATNDGFKLSEFDLKMRGPGEIFGLAQSGRREGGLVDLKRDVELVERAREKAANLLQEDPTLQSPVNEELRKALKTRYDFQLASIS